MPRDTGEAVLRISTRGLRKYERLTQEDRRFLQSTLQEFIEGTGQFAVGQLRHHAPERTGHLKENIQVTGRNRSTTKPNIRVGVDVRSPEGFPYVPVTRFGRVAVEAKGMARPARTYPKGKVGRGYQKRPFRGKMLRFEPGKPGSGFIYTRRVRAYRPRRDWVGKAEGRIKQATLELMEDYTEMVEADLLGGSRGIRRRVGVRRLR